MATSLPNGIYTGGAVKFDSSPYANFYLQSLAKQQARRDAIDNYYNELGKNLTPAGMASNDVDDFVSKVNDWRNYVSSNRGILDNPRDKNYSSAVNQANYLYNDALAHAAKSKQKVASITQTRQLIKPDHPLTDESLLTIHNGTLPLSDKNYKDIDLSTIQYEDALTPAKIDSVINNSIKGIHLGSEIKDVAIDPITHTKKYTTTFKYDQPNLDALRSNAAFALRNPQIKKYVHDIMQPDGMTMKDGVPVPSSALYDQLNKNFKDAYGRDIDDETDAWTAVLLTRAKQAYQTQKAVNDQESLHQSNRNYDIAHPLPHYGSGGVNPNTGSNWGEDAADALKNNDTDTFNNLINYTKQGNGKIQIIDAFVRNIDGNDFVFVQTAPKYSNGKLGNTNTQKIALKDSALPNILFGIYQSAMGADAKQERSNYPTPTPPKTTPKPPATKAYKYNGKNISLDAIKKAADASGLTVDEYIKKAGIQ